jgi:hypothetical protein
MKNLDITNQRFGKLVAVRIAKKDRTNHWECHCDCGKTTVVDTRYLRSGNTKSCGCLRCVPQSRDMTGRRFDRLLVVGRSSGNTKKRAFWRCKCDCGNVCTVMGKLLRSGMTRSCGCLHIEHCHEMRVVNPFGDSAFNQLYATYKYQAKVRNHDFALTKEQFKILTQGDCYYCGMAPSQMHPKVKRHNNGYYIYNGVDRVDSSVGYYLENCVPCCGGCNHMKKQKSAEEFIRVCTAVVEHQKKRAEVLLRLSLPKIVTS